MPISSFHRCVSFPRTARATLMNARAHGSLNAFSRPEQPRHHGDHGQESRQSRQLGRVAKYPETPLKSQRLQHRNALTERHMFSLCSSYVRVKERQGRVVSQFRELNFMLNAEVR